jgi:hypothetical protein
MNRIMLFTLFYLALAAFHINLSLVAIVAILYSVRRSRFCYSFYNMSRNQFTLISNIRLKE